MSEKRIICDGLEINYKGLFEINDLLRKIDEITATRGYAKFEKRREQLTRETHREFKMELRPTKKKSDYFALMIKIRMHITNMEDVEVTRDKIKMRLNKGNINMIFDAWTTTDYEWRWEQKPLFYFLRNIFERAIYKFHTDKHTGELDDDCHFIKNNIKAYLELQKFAK